LRHPVFQGTQQDTKTKNIQYSTTKPDLKIKNLISLLKRILFIVMNVVHSLI